MVFESQKRGSSEVATSPSTGSFQTGPALKKGKGVAGSKTTTTPSGKQALYDRFVSQIGNTPLIDLSSLSPNPQVRILAKAEFLNPSCSIKDRIANHILSTAEKDGKLKPGGTVVCASSGNTGASVAMIASMRGYRSIITTSAKTSSEKCDIIRAYGAELIIAPSGVPADSPKHYMNVADQIAADNPDYFNVEQYDNPLNPEAYYLTLAPEIWEQTAGEVTHYVAAGSTGGTISGVGRYLKEKNPDVSVVLADPVGSIFYEYWKTGQVVKPKSFQVEGVGKDSIPGALDIDLVDDMVQVTCKEAFHTCHRMSAAEGILSGGSSGLNVAAAIKLAEKLDGPATIVTILPDHGMKYLSKIYNPDWLKANNLA